MKIERIEIPFGAQNLAMETGKLAKQANGAVTVTCGGTIVLVTACIAQKPREGIDFFPLTVEYQEKTYSAGRIPGGFFKREGRPTEKEILTSRMIDRPIRPLFPEGLFNEVQVVATVLSSDGENDPDVLALNGASAALMISDIPFDGPVGSVRVASCNGEWLINPTFKQREECELDFIVVGHSGGVVMIEGEAKEVPEAKVEEALRFAHKALLPLCEIQKEFRKEAGKEKSEVVLLPANEKLLNKVRELSRDRLSKVYQLGEKEQREDAISDLVNDVTEDMSVFDPYKAEGQDEIPVSEIRRLIDQVEYEEVRRMIFEKNRRADGRGPKDLRQISGEVSVLPRTHGSSLFTRGQTQSLAIVTLGTRTDEQLIESLEGTSYRTFMLHYNFPSFSVGETRPMRGPGRREIGHGALAAKSLKAVLPRKDEFPYTIRVVSEILESNGSSSMASVCASTLSLMDAGVPIKEPVAGISVGMVTEGEKAVLLTDIMGLEDHFGDMDFKVAGTRKGVTAIQLDMKVKKVALDLLGAALEQARDARFKILDIMHAAIPAPRKEISQYAPKIVTCQISPEKIGEVIGSGGKTIKKIIEETGVASIDIEDDGTVLISSTDMASAEKALVFVRGLTEDPEIGRIYDAKVKKVTNFGAFCEFLPGKEGLVHVSELSSTYVKDVASVVKVGDQFKVKLVEIDDMRRVNLSKKKADEELGLVAKKQ
ncbi:MAG: polyribonucleotide nucleotidyltransferase [Candidatus Omnitrophota bacterium]|nr:polyribonucleotide nucleotidyltransferase [Candidatus Omnitrophota bacterium]MDZ4243096.1 polyribonucleotide nucleotidyltransferase [Candidatus Omnitrophota bacterium]